MSSLNCTLVIASKPLMPARGGPAWCHIAIAVSTAARWGLQALHKLVLSAWQKQADHVTVSFFQQRVSQTLKSMRWSHHSEYKVEELFSVDIVLEVLLRATPSGVISVMRHPVARDCCGTSAEPHCIEL